MSSVMETTRPFTGSKKLVVSLDIGTTFSGASYSILQKGRVPEIKPVTRFAHQDHVGGDTKVPSILLYSQTDGRLIAAGAQALQLVENIYGETSKSWYKVEWFKLHMRPNPQATSYITKSIPPLPPNKGIVDVFADFLKYLHESVNAFLLETHYSGPSLVFGDEFERHFIITHPNGWEGAQQSLLRRAAILAGLIPDTEEDGDRIHFVTEGEAALHFCIRQGLEAEGLKMGEAILVIDAGGGTVDMSAYGQRAAASNNKVIYHEVCVPLCILKGSVFVTRNATEYLKDALRDSSFSSDASIDHISSCFDKTTKLHFCDDQLPYFIRFGGPDNSDPMSDIMNGQIRIAGKKVAEFFEPCIKAIEHAAIEQKAHATKRISCIFLVGGFSASNWLYRKLKESLKKSGLEVRRPDCHLSKAVADGAVSYYIDHLVKARVAPFTYGISAYIPYDATKEEHRRRLESKFTDADGVDNIQNAFSAILYKGTEVMEVTEFREKFFRKAATIEELPDLIHDAILCYRGENQKPEWTDVESEMYTTLCKVESDISDTKKFLRRRRGKDGKSFYCLDYEVILQFGLTELAAQTCIVSRGKEIRSVAKLIYDP